MVFLKNVMSVLIQVVLCDMERGSPHVDSRLFVVPYSHKYYY